MNRIYVDFNTTQTDERGRVHINTDIYPELLDQIKEGMRVVFFDEELEVEGVTEYDTRYRFWLGVPDWSTRRDL
jgi:hypothetical protein